MIQFFTTVFYQPLLNLLVFVYNVIPGHDIGLAIIILTILIKAILYPFNAQSLKSQKQIQEIQPKIDALKQQYKDNKEKQASELMKLYKEEKVNPFSSCLPLLIQLPFLIAIYQVFNVGLTKDLSLIYPFIDNPIRLSPIAFGFFDLSKALPAVAVLAGLAQFFQTKMMFRKKPVVKGEGSKDEDMMAMMNNQMMYMMPIMTVVIGFTLPGGLTLYWLVLTILNIFQQMIVFRKPKTPEIEVVNR